MTSDRLEYKNREREAHLGNTAISIAERGQSYAKIYEILGTRGCLSRREGVAKKNSHENLFEGISGNLAFVCDDPKNVESGGKPRALHNSCNLCRVIRMECEWLATAISSISLLMDMI
jgi:hypothetical protein